jgi:hypothetical protein
MSDVPSPEATDPFTLTTLIGVLAITLRDYAVRHEVSHAMALHALQLLATRIGEEAAQMRRDPGTFRRYVPSHGSP